MIRLSCEFGDAYGAMLIMFCALVVYMGIAALVHGDTEDRIWGGLMLTLSLPLVWIAYLLAR